MSQQMPAWNRLWDWLLSDAEGNAPRRDRSGQAEERLVTFQVSSEDADPSLLEELRAKQARRAQRAQKEAAERSDPLRVPGVYFLQCPASKRIKIGFSTTPWQRFETLSTAAPVPLIWLGFVPGERSDERRIHDRFSEYRANREWFLPSEEILEWLAEHSISLIGVSGLESSCAGTREPIE